MKVWLLKVDGFDACGDPWTREGIYSTESRGIIAFVRWLAAYGRRLTEMPTSLDGPFDRESIAELAREVFDRSEVDCGPQDWSLTEVEVDAPFADVEEWEDDAGTEYEGV